MKYWNSAVKSRFIAFFVLSFFLQISFVGSGYAQKFQFDYNIKKDWMSFKSVKNLVIIPIFINEKGPFNFILDTGVDPLIITDLSIIDKSKLTNLRNVKINGAGEGDEISAYFSNDITVKVGDAFMNHMPTVILQDDVFNLSTYLGLKIHGLIGYYFFNSFIVKINYSQSRLSFHLPENRKKIKWNKVDLEFLDNKPYINTDIQLPDLGKIKAKLIVDGGASHALSLESYMGGDFPIPSPSFQANLGVGLGGKINGSIGRVSSIKLGEFELKNVLTGFPNYKDVAAKAKQKERTGNIGSDILKRFTIIFDYQGRAMYLKKNGNYKEAFEHDMSGIELYADDRFFNRIFISRVEAASPAEKAGILANDEIISINFIQVSHYSLDDITNLLKSSSGRTLLIEFARKDKIYIKLLTLKRRI